MAIKEDLVKAGADKLADLLISLYESEKALKKRLTIMFAGLEDDPKKLISAIKKEIAAIGKAKRYIDYDEIDDFAQMLDQLRQRIAIDLFAKSADSARELMESFLDLNEGVFRRIDWGRGGVGDVFREACSDLGKVYGNLKAPIESLVAFVFEKFTTDENYVYRDIISNFKDSLGKKGLTILQEKFEKSLNNETAYEVSNGLKEVADCLKDVDAYIKACSIRGTASVLEKLAISRRLLDHWREKEALEWLETTKDLQDFETKHYDRAIRALKIQAFDALHDYKNAQRERIEWFDETLDPVIYGEIVKHSKPEVVEDFKKKAIEKAFSSDDCYYALYFLMSIQEFDECSRIVRAKIKQYDGREHQLLRKAAESLQNTDPFASTLLYRKLIDTVLSNAISKHYAHAAKDLVQCAELSKQIDNWEKLEPHEDYFKSIQEQHRSKRSFWPEYNALSAKSKKND